MSASVRFAGYAAIFDAVDRGGDVIRAGAFAGMSAGVPLLWQHRGAPVGAIEAIGTDARGLRVVARVDDPRLAGLLRSGAVSGLSIGYHARGVRRPAGSGRVRELTALDLVEVSLVAAPMQPAARVHLVADAARPGHPDAVPDSGRRRAERRNDHG